MNPPIVISSSESSDDEKPVETSKESIKIAKKSDAEEIFVEFCELCEALIQENTEGNKILQWLKDVHGKAPPTYKCSREYRKLLQSSVKKLKAGGKNAYVHIHDIVTKLDKNNGAPKRTLQSNGDTLTKSKKSKTSNDEATETQDSGEHKKNGEAPTTSKTVRISPEVEGTEDKQSEGQDSIPCTSEGAEVPPMSSRSRQESARIKKLERYLKTLSKEIIRLQSVELSLSDLEDENSDYIQESKLKKRFMKVYYELCRLQKCKPKTGRVIEKKICVTGTRFPEINKEIELFINKSKERSCLPDFEEVCVLVKAASSKSQLGLSDREIDCISRDVFKEVGNKMQKRRHKDFTFEFGSSITDDFNQSNDPASSDPTLHEALKKNRSIAVQSLETVINKYATLQTSRPQQDPENDIEDDEVENDTSESESEISENHLQMSDSPEVSTKENDAAEIILE